MKIFRVVGMDPLIVGDDAWRPEYVIVVRLVWRRHGVLLMELSWTGACGLHGSEPLLRQELLWRWAEYWSQRLHWSRKLLWRLVWYWYLGQGLRGNLPLLLHLGLLKGWSVQKPRSHNDMLWNSRGWGSHLRKRVRQVPRDAR